uniref:non-specific serine/threonine protein kinase n=1 Tax=Phallusia mammillata TaxID=59560 RepID=A0A6F9DRK0_9ASCI|nr:serine/threonine-protein kinase SIK2 [Phallusia mammillata]
METSSTIYLVCEYASHGEVFDFITREEKVPEEKARRMFYQVLCAIEYCHKNNVVHRDLKAENLLLDANDNIKLADFGFGNFFQSGQNLNTWCGSPPYAAPEVFEGKLYEGPQLDVWSLGIVLYVLVCGTFPFDGSNLTILKERVLAGRFRIPFWMSQDCENLIRRMLVVNPKKRLTISQIKKHKWMQVFAAKPEISLQKIDSTAPRVAGMPEFNEHILKLVQSLGIDRQKTLESLRNSTYDHLYAIYHLLVDRLKQHRTSFPLEARTYDASKRRPSHIADQTLSKFSSVNPNISPFQPDVTHKPQFFPPVKRHPPPISPLTSFDDDVVAPEVQQTTTVDKRFGDDLSQEIPQVQRTLAFTASHQPRLPHSPTNKPHFTAQGNNRTPLPHQPWSFHSGVRISAYQRFSSPGTTPPRYRECGEGLPSVTSIDEGVELSDVTEEQSELMRSAVQHRRHTLVVPDVTSYPPTFSQRSLEGGTGTLNRSSGFVGAETPPQDSFHRPTSYNDSLSSAFSEPSDVLEMDFNNTISDVTPKVVLSPCDEIPYVTSQSMDQRAAQIDNQRQLLDVSPTGFREGRRASDGLLLLGDNRIGEHLKRLTRVQGFPTISQEEADDGCLESSDAESDHVTKPYQLNHLSVQSKPNEFGMMSSHSSHHVMKGNDVINYQPYASSYRRRSLQVSQMLGEGSSCSVTLNPSPTSNQSAAEQLAIFQQQYASSDVTDLEGPYQWSSWKCVKETENNRSTGQNPSPARRSDNASHLFYAAPFAVASDESMIRSAAVEQAKRQPSLPSPTAHHLVGQQSLAQQLQQRRLKRRLKVAHNMQPTNTSYQLPVSELQHLKIDGDFAQTSYPPPLEPSQCQFVDDPNLLQATFEPTRNFPPAQNALSPANFPFRSPSFDEQRQSFTQWPGEVPQPTMEFTFT